jgi:hypothetical protein
MSAGTTDTVPTTAIDRAPTRRDHGEQVHSRDWRSMLAKSRSLAAAAVNVLAHAFAESAYWIPFAPLPWPLIAQRDRVGGGSRG